MPGFTPFTSNYQDLSTNQGYQFEFRCDVCGSGYRSEYQKNLLGVGGSILGGASSILGGRFWGAASAANTAQDITDRDARDKALQKASNEIMPLFHRCVRCNNWVDETCFNKARGLCVNCAPNLAAEMEAERSSVEVSPDARGGPQHHGLLGRHQRPRDGVPQLRQAGRQREVLRQLRHAFGRGQVLQVRRRAGGRHSLLRELRQPGRLARAAAARNHPARREDRR